MGKQVMWEAVGIAGLRKTDLLLVLRYLKKKKKISIYIEKRMIIHNGLIPDIPTTYKPSSFFLHCIHLTRSNMDPLPWRASKRQQSELSTRA